MIDPTVCACGDSVLMHLIGWPTLTDKLPPPPPCSIRGCKCAGYTPKGSNRPKSQPSQAKGRRVIHDPPVIPTVHRDRRRYTL